MTRNSGNKHKILHGHFCGLFFHCPGLRVIVNLRVVLEDFALDLLERALASVRFFLPGRISDELVLVLQFIDEKTELLRRLLSCLHFWHGWRYNPEVCTLSPFVAEIHGCLPHKHSYFFFLYQGSSSEKPGSLLFIDTAKDAVSGGGHFYSLFQCMLSSIDRCPQRTSWSRAGYFQQCNSVSPFSNGEHC